MADRRPNIVFVLTDDHAAHSIGCYGSVVNETPRIDEIAENGWRFDNCFVTNSLCTPSRASILTGTYSHVNGVYSLFTPIDASQPTFISLLRDAGYQTAMIGKWHMGHGEGHDPEGFDHWEVLPGQGDYWNPTFINRRTVAARSRATRPTSSPTCRSTGSSRSRATSPWCVLVWHKAPHRSVGTEAGAPGAVRRAAPGAGHVLGRLLDPERVGPSSCDADRRPPDHRRPQGEVPPEGLSYEEQAVWKYQRYMRDYLACVHSVDENVGRLTDWLRERGDFDDTMMMYSSDQGFFLGDHGWFDKRLMFEESLRMPFLLSYPNGSSAGQVVRRHRHQRRHRADDPRRRRRADHVERMQGRSFWPDLWIADPIEAP